MIEKYIKALHKISNPEISNGEELKAWQGKAINVIIRVYGENSIQEEQIKNIYFETYDKFIQKGQTILGGGNNSEACKKQASEVIKGFIDDLTSFGMPAERKHEISNGINISISQNQNQTIKLKLIYDSIKDELTGKQLKEIDDVLKETGTSETKKTKLITKLKSFGADVASNIIANILTNPNLFS